MASNSNSSAKATNKATSKATNQATNKATSKASATSKDAMDRFKSEVATDMGVNLKNGYNGNLTSKEAGSVGGEMVRRMIKNQEDQMK